MSGTALAIKKKGKSTADVIEVAKVVIKKQRYTLVPGIQKTQRRVTVLGSAIDDVPTKYTMTGLQSYEIPVVGKLYK